MALPILRLDQDAAGAIEGRKNRPCAIVVTTVDDEGDTMVYVAPITHSRPDPGTAVELPAGVKRRLGLDASALATSIRRAGHRLSWAR